MILVSAIAVVAAAVFFPELIAVTLFFAGVQGLSLIIRRKPL